jgi:hypothetical protein
MKFGEWPTTPQKPKQEEPGRLMITPEGKENLIKKWMSVENVKSFFDRKSRQFFGLAQGNDKNFAGKYVDWLKKEGKSSNPEAGKEFKDESQESCTRYNEILSQVREGNLYVALEEIEEVSNQNTEWDNEKKEVVHTRADNLEELRAMSIALTDDMSNKKGEVVPKASEQELQSYFQELMKEWDDDDSKNWLAKAIETKDYKALADQIDISISAANAQMQRVKDRDMGTIRYIEKKSTTGERPIMYLHRQLKDLRRFRKYLFEKSREK